ncbi:MDR family MFS transporter [Loigolactobacillus coryniformis subsp. coryniformis]|nr:MDR family MFS transporter [Loigolactobacillus coryniformis]ATO56514.1 MFS transporter [Loigolactobacillus coryniformis subsp. coryniformis KCTC 3167 = DSM 20001]MDN5953649.1 multidrug efflux MFS transporter [Loigolactobacillus coryniformis]MDT3391830.1 multidrug efflux MFS transporter [Bacillota bacterium]OEH89600.1 MFS transporter [Loigolactobacillus coryniformis subsp. coryniformis]
MSTKTPQIPRSVMTIAWILVFGAMAPLLDSTMINIAIHNLVHDLNSSVTTVQWTITGYLLATGIAVPFSSWLLNKFNGKHVFLAGEVLFALGSILSALAPNIQWLISARVIQGFAGGLIMPLLTTLLVQTAGAAAMGQMMATVGLPMILGPLFGPVLGGIIIKSLSWHWIFWVNVPVGIISISLILWKMPDYPAQNKAAKMDFGGIILLAGATTSIIYGIVKASKLANFTNQTTLTFLGSGLLLLIGYLIWAALRKEKAVLPLNLFTHASFNGAGLGLLLAGTVLNGAMLLLPLFFQDVRGMTVMQAGLALIPQGAGMLVARTLTGRLTDSLGAKYVVLVSLVITFIGTLPFYWFDAHTAYWLIACVLIVRGIGAGGILMPLMADAYTGMKPQQVPAASIGSRIIQNIGSALGSALIATLVTAYTNTYVKSFQQQLANGRFHIPATQRATFAQQHLATIKLHAFQYGFLFTAIAALAIILPALLLTNKMNDHHA